MPVFCPLSLFYVSAQHEYYRAAIYPRLTGKRKRLPNRSLFWSRRQDLNLRPHGPEPCALPDCATPRRHAAGRLSARRYECYFTLFFIRCQMFVGGEPHFMRFSVSCPHVFHAFPRRAFSALRCQPTGGRRVANSAFYSAKIFQTRPRCAPCRENSPGGRCRCC